MASSLMFAIFVIIGAMVPISASAKEIIVGDGAGWRLGFDYQAWAKTKKFRVGDKLVFQYPVGYHNVFRVKGTVFQSCTLPPANEALTTGNDTIVLGTPGNKWYICGVGKHCENGMRLAITVQPAYAKAPSSPSPAPVSASSKEIIIGDETGWRLGFDYQAWAKTKDFRVGDKLVFQYRVGHHNVFRVTGTVFQSCIIPPANEALTTGNDTIVLATPGNKWYICGVGKHCEKGMRLAITVQPAYGKAPSPSPAPVSASSKVIIVGDDAGWRLGFDYQSWAQTKDFRVGDKLIFKYPVEAHNVFRVNGTGFRSCIKPPANKALTTGNDTILLATPGRKWYICGVGKHCENGMRLAITVKPACGG